MKKIFDKVQILKEKSEEILKTAYRRDQEMRDS